jgi:hypothetical protein
VLVRCSPECHVAWLVGEDTLVLHVEGLGICVCIHLVSFTRQVERLIRGREEGKGRES